MKRKVLTPGEFSARDCAKKNPHKFTEHEVREAERQILEMLEREHPELSPTMREKLAHDGALQSLKIAVHEVATGDHAVLICTCTHPDRPDMEFKGHLDATGKCLTPGCECVEFNPKTVKTDVKN